MRFGKWTEDDPDCIKYVDDYPRHKLEDYPICPSCTRDIVIGFDRGEKICTSCRIREFCSQPVPEKKNKVIKFIQELLF